MKALSIRQPWVWCILYLGKPVENRDWQPDGPNMRQAKKLVGTVIALHAGQTISRDDYEDCLSTVHDISRGSPFKSGMMLPERTELERGGIVCVARLAGIVSDDVAPDDYGDQSLLAAARASPWFFGRFGLVLTEVRKVPFVKVKGTLGFFDVPEVVL
jgi:hypothetical protein